MVAEVDPAEIGDAPVDRDELLVVAGGEAAEAEPRRVVEADAGAAALEPADHPLRGGPLAPERSRHDVVRPPAEAVAQHVLGEGVHQHAAVRGGTGADRRRDGLARGVALERHRLDERRAFRRGEIAGHRIHELRCVDQEPQAHRAAPQQARQGDDRREAEQASAPADEQEARERVAQRAGRDADEVEGGDAGQGAREEHGRGPGLHRREPPFESGEPLAASGNEAAAEGTCAREIEQSLGEHLAERHEDDRGRRDPVRGEGDDHQQVGLGIDDGDEAAHETDCEAAAAVADQPCGLHHPSTGE